MPEIGPPLAAPGERFAYCDAGYVRLSQVIEGATGRPLGSAVQRLLRWDALGLSDLRWKNEPPAPGPARAHQWMDGIDTTGVHGSIDPFGGGGLVASVADAARAYAAIAFGARFDRVETLAGPGHPDGSPYRMGLLASGAGEAVVYRHGGLWGLHAVKVPSCARAIVAVGLDQDSSPRVVQMAEGLAGCD